MVRRLMRIAQKAGRFGGKTVKVFPFFVFFYEWGRGKPALAAADLAARDFACANEVERLRGVLGQEFCSWMRDMQLSFGYYGAAARSPDDPALVIIPGE